MTNGELALLVGIIIIIIIIIIVAILLSKKYDTPVVPVNGGIYYIVQVSTGLYLSFDPETKLVDNTTTKVPWKIVNERKGFSLFPPAPDSRMGFIQISLPVQVSGSPNNTWYHSGDVSGYVIGSEDYTDYCYVSSGAIVKTSTIEDDSNKFVYYNV